jgi:hypothetical protein
VPFLILAQLSNPEYFSRRVAAFQPVGGRVAEVEVATARAR